MDWVAVIRPQKQQKQPNRPLPYYYYYYYSAIRFREPCILLVGNHLKSKIPRKWPRFCPRAPNQPRPNSHHRMFLCRRFQSEVDAKEDMQGSNVKSFTPPPPKKRWTSRPVSQGEYECSS